MSTSKNPLLMAKQNLSSSLGVAEWKSYLGLLKQWFKRIITKETFDAEARKLCAADRRSLQRHNDFLLALFSTCQSLAGGVGSSGGGAGVSANALPSVAVVATLVKPIVDAPVAAFGPTTSGVGGIVSDGAALSAKTKFGGTAGAIVTSDGAAKSGKSCVSSSSSSYSASSLPAPPTTPVTDGGVGGAASAAVVSAASTPSGASSSAPAPAQVASASPTHVNAPVKTKERRHKKETKTKKPKTNKISFHNNFTPTNPLAYCQQIVPKPPEEEQGLAFSFRERTLPDVSLIHGRMLVGAWDVGLECVDEAAVRFLHVAVEMQVRSLLLKMVKERNCFKLRDGRFPSHFASEQTNIYSRHAKKDRDDEEDTTFASDEDGKAAYHLGSAIAAGVKRKSRPPLGLAHLRDTLQRNKNAVASHTVYAINVERILNAMEHPTSDEILLEDERRREKEKRVKTDERQQLMRLW